MADALTAARLLHLEVESNLNTVMELLGLRSEEEPTPPAPRRRTVEPDRPRQQGGGPTPEGKDGSATSAPTGMRTMAEPLPAEPVEPIAFDQAEPLAPGPAGSGTVAYEPIVPLHQVRPALAMIIRRLRRSVEVDIETVVDVLAEQRPLDNLPRLLEHTLDRGITIVADVGPEMLPYLEDVEHLIAATQLVAGALMTRVVWVEDSDDVPALDTDRPIMIISTLGAARAPMSAPGTAVRWRDWARAMTEAEADLTALVPYRRLRWSDDDISVRFVAWDDLAEVGRGRT